MYLRPKGYSVVIDAWGNETREDTAKCAHCQRILFFGPRSDPNEFFCRSCYSPICPNCANSPCDVYERKLDRIEATDAWLRERLSDKVEKMRSSAAAIEIGLRRQQMLKDMGFG